MFWRDWTRGERLALIGIIIMLLAAIAAWLVVPGFRAIFKLSSPSFEPPPPPPPPAPLPDPLPPPPGTLNSTQPSVANRNIQIGSGTALNTGEQLKKNIRLTHNVRKLDITENGLPFNDAPRGVFGFYYAFSVLNSEYIKLNRINDDFTYFELHKLHDGTGEIIGFVSPDVASHLTREDRPAGYPVTLYNMKWPSATSIVSIPFNFIKAIKPSRTITIEEEEEDVYFQALDITLK